MSCNTQVCVYDLSGELVAVYEWPAPPFSRRDLAMLYDHDLRGHVEDEQCTVSAQFPLPSGGLCELTDEWGLGTYWQFGTRMYPIWLLQLAVDSGLFEQAEQEA